MLRQRTAATTCSIHSFLSIPYPVTMSIFPVLLFYLLHAATYTKTVLDAKGSNSLPLLRSLLDKLSTNQQNILKFIACNEIFLMPATVFMLFR